MNRLWLGLLGVLVVHVGMMPGQEPSRNAPPQQSNLEEEDMDEDRLMPNVPLPTMGGMQLWTDHRWYFGWRLQHNIVTDHWRVISPKGVRTAWGGQRACLAKWQWEVQNHPQHDPKTIVVLVHGLMRTAGSMDELEEAVTNELKLTVASFSYASTRNSIENHAAAFREWTENLPGNPKLLIVGHSLGNIVVRHAIGDWQESDPQKVLSRMSGMVMLGPPNNGSGLAKQLSRLGLFEIVTGRSGMELGPEWQKVQGRLAIPSFPCHIIAGDLTDSNLRNPLIDEEGDLVVTLEETQLSDIPFTSVPVLHSFLPTDERSVELTTKLLEEWVHAIEKSHD